MTETVRHTRPDWLLGCWTEACNQSDRTHSLLEAVLGLARMVDAGDVVEARRLHDEQVRPEMIRMQLSPGATGEKDSTQLLAMIDSGLYPEDLCAEAVRLVGAVR